MKLKPLLYTLILVSNLAFAQLDTRINVDDLISKKAVINFEMGYDKFSLELGNRFLFGPWATVGTTDADGNLIDEIPIRRFGYVGTLRANYYPKPKNSIDGFHISPTLDFMRQKVQFDEPTINTRLGASIMFGYKYVIGESPFSIQSELGLGYWFMDKSRLASGGSVTGEEFLEDTIGFLKKFRAIRMPFNITVNYRIGQ
jgi:hypothetical protein